MLASINVIYFFANLLLSPRMGVSGQYNDPERLSDNRHAVMRSMKLVRT